MFMKLASVVVAALALAGTADGGAPNPDWNQLASFYAQRPVTVEFSDSTSSAYTNGFGRIVLGRAAQRSLEQLAVHAHDVNTGPGLGTLGLGTLIHEALHNRDFHTPNPFDDWSRNPVTGYYSAGNECQAGILGYERVVGAMYLFFDVPLGSPLSLRYGQVARQLEEPWRNRCEAQPFSLRFPR